MTADETSLIKLLDEFGRKRHRCFLAEMFLRTKDAGYCLCPRPLGVKEDSSSRYKCKYLVVSVDQIRSAAEMGTLPVPFIEQLNVELSALRQSI